VREVFARITAHPLSRWIISQVVNPIDRSIARVFRGRMPLLTSLFLPTLLLEVEGRSSGLPRKVPLMYLRDGDAYVVANARPRNERKSPWVLNLEAAATATIRVREVEDLVSVRLADEAYVQEMWPRFVVQWPAFEHYYQSTGDRWVFRLEPIE
jgi:deazaflavin-dependent oxidoreductase (nitroreductase family)